MGGDLKPALGFARQCLVRSGAQNSASAWRSPLKAFRLLGLPKTHVFAGDDERPRLRDGPPPLDAAPVDHVVVITKISTKVSARVAACNECASAFPGPSKVNHPCWSSVKHPNAAPAAAREPNPDRLHPTRSGDLLRRQAPRPIPALAARPRTSRSTAEDMPREYP